MQTVYAGNRDLEVDDLKERNRLLTKYRYSVIVEGGHLEFDNLYKWINQNIGTDTIEDIYYGKTDYDYGFAEFFISDKIHEQNLKLAVQNIYTIYPDSNPPGKISKSDGREKDIEYSSADKEAIIYPVDAKT
jgi:hypothetical protein